MKITDVKIKKSEKKGVILGYATVVLDKAIVLKNIRIIETEKSGRFLSMPSQKKIRDDKAVYFDHFHPISSDARQQITQAVLDAYDNLENE